MRMYVRMMRMYVRMMRMYVRMMRTYDMSSNYDDIHHYHTFSKSPS
jgi:hypothetical protein